MTCVDMDWELKENGIFICDIIIISIAWCFMVVLLCAGSSLHTYIVTYI